MRKDVEFKSQGTTCRGWLYMPEKGPKPFPLVVMAGGWCYVREIVMPHYAECLEQAGIATLLFDYRNFGVSDGEPRQHLDPNMQVEDYKNAISFARRIPEVDPERIGIWGISYSGGHVLVVGATDPRVKCIVSVVPVIDGLLTLIRSHGMMAWRRLEKAILEDRERRFEGTPSEYIPMSDEQGTICTFAQPETRKVFLQIKDAEAPLHDHRNTIESVELLMSYNVYPFAERILNTPVLMLVAEGDDHCWWEWCVEAFKSIGTPAKDKRLDILPKTTHLSLYDNRARMEKAAKITTDWYVQHLLKPKE